MPVHYECYNRTYRVAGNRQRLCAGWEIEFRSPMPIETGSIKEALNSSNTFPNTSHKRFFNLHQKGIEKYCFSTTCNKIYSICNITDSPGFCYLRPLHPK
jgi:hypothetical protein